MKTINISSRKQWRNWLDKNHNKESKVNIILHKKHTGKPSISHKESMYEAICYGWIDTTLKKLDEDTYQRSFAKRNDKSKWSQNTLKYGKELIKEGLMTPIGLKRYKEGLKKGAFDPHRYSDAPEELIKALKKSKKAFENFNNFSPSTKRYYIHWVTSAKRPETIKKRIKETCQRSKDNLKPGIVN